MSGATVTKMPRKTEPRRITLTPEMATQLLESNAMNRPLSDTHVQRIAGQIRAGKWRFNGDTIKVAEGGDVLDGQHRLWAVIESKTPVETCIIYGIERDAFATVDTLRKPRSGSDILALCGATRDRQTIAMGLTWMLRWQRGVLESYKAPQNRIENSDVEDAFRSHPGIVRAAERARHIRTLANPGIMTFLYYIMVNRNMELAERMMNTLEDPAGVRVSDPFYRLRSYFTADHHRRKEPLVTIALAIKAANAAKIDKKVEVLNWKHQGERVEAFPTLDI